MYTFRVKTLSLITLVLLTCSATAEAADDSQRSFKQYDDLISKWLVAEATAKTATDHELAIVELARLYSELVQDPRIRISPTLNQYRVKVRARLMKVQRELEVRIARNLTFPNRTVSDKLQSTLKRHLAATSSHTGGAQQLLSPRAGAALPDYGPQLVALIQRTITPKFWDVNGGPGVIVYYPPLRLLVVRATSQVHGQIRNLNGKLR